MKTARHTHIITGLPDTYGRGRIVGDYRRVALYGIDALIKFKQEDFANCGDGNMTDDVIRLREEIARQINALKGMKKMAEAYGYDISQPAKTAKEACQWLYFGYLAAIKMCIRDRFLLELDYHCVFHSLSASLPSQALRASSPKGRAFAIQKAGRTGGQVLSLIHI